MGLQRYSWQLRGETILHVVCDSVGDPNSPPPWREIRRFSWQLRGETILHAACDSVGDPNSPPTWREIRLAVIADVPLQELATSPVGQRCGPAQGEPEHEASDDAKCERCPAEAEVKGYGTRQASGVERRCTPEAARGKSDRLSQIETLAEEDQEAECGEERLDSGEAEPKGSPATPGSTGRTQKIR
ncbi:hypothetical protein HPB50_007397 [Hyalomma asiaticum]|uniref:Uncharacterized protein n=1 Tax=Hyalomma asiaticum TaxID=266040 RepID=A0ACB7RUT1_HYAAI|nr:hypothetical protein HPB50_007397 [Hyalomma asiaticum]